MTKYYVTVVFISEYGQGVSKYYDTLEEATKVFENIKYQAASSKFVDFGVMGYNNTLYNSHQIYKIFMSQA